MGIAAANPRDASDTASGAVRHPTITERRRAAELNAIAIALAAGAKAPPSPDHS